MSDTERKLLAVIFWMVLGFAVLFALTAYVPSAACRRFVDQLGAGSRQDQSAAQPAGRAP